MRRVLALVALSAAFAQLAAAQKMVGGPFVVNVSARNATVVWVVEDRQLTLQGPDGAARTSPTLRTEKTTLTGLEPNKRYEYSVPGQDGSAATKGSFKTPPAGAGSYSFVVYGDTRTRHDVHRGVMAELLKHGVPDFVLHTGDMVADGNDTSLWPIFFDIEKDLLRQTAFFPSLGNHERNTHYFGDLFQADAPYYSFNWGNAHFAVLNSDIANAATSQRTKDAFWGEQTRWLEDDLAAHQNSAYRFVVAHHPPFTAVFRRQGANAEMTALVPLFEKYHVSAGFFGHDHNYQHYLKNGIHYVITGGGGAPLYDVGQPPADITQKVVSVENFVSVRMDGKSMHVQAIAIDGRTLDEFEIGGSKPIGRPGDF